MHKNKTFDAEVFEQLKKAEANHFWFKVRCRWIFDKIKNIRNHLLICSRSGVVQDMLVAI